MTIYYNFIAIIPKVTSHSQRHLSLKTEGIDYSPIKSAVAIDPACLDIWRFISAIGRSLIKTDRLPGVLVSTLMSRDNANYFESACTRCRYQICG